MWCNDETRFKKHSFSSEHQKSICRLIARKAGIDRQTFYLHFVDKYDLLDKMNKEFLQVYKTILVERLEGDNSFALEKLEKIYFIKVIRHI